MIRFLRRVAGVALLAGSFVLAFLVIRYQPHVEHEIRIIGPLAYPLAIAIFAVVASAPFSVTDALAIMNGAIFGPVRGHDREYGRLVLRGAARLLDQPARLATSSICRSRLERLPPWVKRFPVGSPAFLLAVRIIPGFGGTVATASAAAFRVPIWVHVWTMCAIAVPICTVLAIFGDRVTVAVHGYESRARGYAHHYCLTHRCPHFHFRTRWKETPVAVTHRRSSPIGRGSSRLCARVREAGRVALDTEFHAERTYSPRLMVVQLAFDDGAAIVDALALARFASARRWRSRRRRSSVTRFRRI